MITNNAGLVEHLLRCAQSTCPDPCVQQRPIAVRFIALQVMYFVRLTHLLVGGTSTNSVVVPLPQSLRVCIVGCGQVGSDIVRILISSQMIHPACITIATRQISKCIKFKSQGVVCTQSNQQGVSGADVIVLTCLPSQLSTVAADIVGKMERSALLISTCVGVSPDKVSSLFHHPYCVTSMVSHADVVMFTNVFPEPIDHFVGFPATSALANNSFAYRHTLDTDALSHSLMCLVGFQLQRDKKLDAATAYANAIEAVFSRDALNRRDVTKPVLESGMSVALACRLESVAGALMLSQHTLLDYALHQHVAFLTSFV